MIYFDYQDDLKTFNSLMESIDPVVLLENETPAGEDPKPSEESPSDSGEPPAEESPSDSGEPPAEDTTKAEKSKKKQMKETGSLVSSAMQDAVMGKNDNSDTIRKLLFQAAYQTSENKPGTFAIPNDKGMTIVNNSKSKDFFKQQKKKIVVNFSALIYQCTTKTYLKHLCVATDWDAEASSTTNGFHKAIIKALEKLASIISSGIYGIDDQPKKEPKKKPTNEQNLQGGDGNQTEPPTDNNPTEPPTDEQPPETPTDPDQKEIYKKIMQEFKETQLDLLIADCDNIKQQTSDPDEIKAAGDEITDKYYNELVEPYQDDADDDTKEKVRTIVQYNVNKQLTSTQQGGGDNDNQGNQQGNGNNHNPYDPEPEEPDMPKKKDPNKSENTWWDNTKSAWGLDNNPLYDYKPQGKTLGQLLHERNREKDAENDAKEAYDKQMAAYKKKHDAWEKRQKDNNNEPPEEKDEFDWGQD